VTQDVPQRAVVVGDPARQAGLIGTHGVQVERPRGLVHGTETVAKGERWMCLESDNAFAGFVGMLEPDAVLGLDEVMWH
jgi:hypothetical protein